MYGTMFIELRKTNALKGMVKDMDIKKVMEIIKDIESVYVKFTTESFLELAPVSTKIRVDLGDMSASEGFTIMSLICELGSMSDGALLLGNMDDVN